MATTGPETEALWNKYITGKKGEYEKARVSPKTFGGYRDEGQEAIPTTGREQAEFLSYAGNLGVAQESREWLKGQYYSLFGMWTESGRLIPFLQWVSQYLARG